MTSWPALSFSARRTFPPLFLLLCGAGLLLAQDRSQDDRPPQARRPAAAPTDTSPPPAPKISPEQDGNRIRVQVNLVSILTSVLDAHNRPAAGLPRDAFEVTEEGVPQKIAVFEAETQQPLDLVLMIDSSLSTRMEMDAEREAAAHFIAQVLRPADHLAVYEFDENTTQLAGFSSDVAELQSAVRHITEGSGTSIYDALATGAQALQRRASDHRRVILMITDGGETTSHMDFDAARLAAVRSGTLLYSIILRPFQGEGSRNTAGEHALSAITDVTGGAMFFPAQVSELGAIFDLIDRELRMQYRLGYYPAPRGPASTFRNVEVRVKGPYTVRHRRGYYTAPE